jgi:DNA-binding MarR family transcriptional regulator
MSIQLKSDFSDPSHSDLVSQLMHAEHALSAWTHVYHEAVAQALNLNNTDHKCLDLLKSGQMTPGELAVATGLTTGAVTSVLDRLERRGFVKREHDSEDRRRIIVRVDIEKLKREVAPLFGCLEQGFADLCANYTDDELRFLVEYLSRCQAMLQDATGTLREQGVVAPVEPAIH